MTKENINRDNEKIEEDNVMMKDKVLNMFREDETMMGKDIAEALGVSRQYVAKILNRAGEDAMQRQRDVTELRYKEMERIYREHYSEDITLKEMGEILGVTPSIVSKISQRTGLTFRSLAEVRKQARVDEINELREEGLTLKEVGEKMGVTIGYVSQMVRWGREQEERDKENKTKVNEYEETELGEDEEGKDLDEGEITEKEELDEESEDNIDTREQEKVREEQEGHIEVH